MMHFVQKNMRTCTQALKQSLQEAVDVLREDYCSEWGCEELDLLAEEVIPFRTEHSGNTLLPIPHTSQSLAITTFTISIRAFTAVHQQNPQHKHPGEYLDINLATEASFWGKIQEKPGPTI